MILVKYHIIKIYLKKWAGSFVAPLFLLFFQATLAWVQSLLSAISARADPTIFFIFSPRFHLLSILLWYTLFYFLILYPSVTYVRFDPFLLTLKWAPNLLLYTLASSSQVRYRSCCYILGFASSIKTSHCCCCIGDSQAVLNNVVSVFWTLGPSELNHLVNLKEHCH